MDILIDFVTSFLAERNEDDAFDRLNYQVTPFLLVIFSLVNISKVYIGDAINCFAKAEFSKGWIQYAHDYCLIENTYYLRTNESIPLEHETRGQKHISYYQVGISRSFFSYLTVDFSGSRSFWFYRRVPSIFPISCGDRLIGSRVCLILRDKHSNDCQGFQIRAIITTAKESVSLTLDENKDAVKKIARSVYHASQLKHRTLRIMNELVVLGN